MDIVERRNQIIKLYGLRPNNKVVNRAVDAFLKGEQLGVDHLKYLAIGSGTLADLHDPLSGKIRDEKVYRGKLNLAATKPD